jgi:hypothetical protein
MVLDAHICVRTSVSRRQALLALAEAQVEVNAIASVVQ